VKGAAVPLLALLAVAAGGCEPDCEDEEVTVDVTGTCADGPRRVTFRISACRIEGHVHDGRLAIPVRGELSQAREPFRRGEWQLFGPVCPTTATTCPADRPPEFRRCIATRTDFHIDLACVGGAGAPACRARLTE
jgi:hypothetical protein